MPEKCRIFILPVLIHFHAVADSKGHHRLNPLFYRCFSLSSMGYADLHGVGSLPYLVTPLPKRITDAARLSQHNPLFCLSLPLLALPKRAAFGKVSCMAKHRLLPHMTASLYLGLHQAAAPCARDVVALPGGAHALCRR